MVETKPPVFISITGRITEELCRSLVNAVSVRVAQGVGEFHLLLNSSGGDLAPSISTYHTLNGMKDARFATHNLGAVDSSAILLYLVAPLERRFAVRGASFMIHGASVHVEAGYYNLFFATIFRDNVLRLNDEVTAIIKAETLVDMPELLFQSEETHDTGEAARIQVMNVVETLSIPPGAEVLTL